MKNEHGAALPTARELLALCAPLLTTFPLGEADLAARAALADAYEEAGMGWTAGFVREPGYKLYVIDRRDLNYANWDTVKECIQEFKFFTVAEREQFMAGVNFVQDDLNVYVLHTSVEAIHSVWKDMFDPRSYE